MKPLTFIVLTLSLLTTSPYSKATVVRVVALFSDKAMLTIDDRRQVLKVGGRTVNGVRLLKANSKMALLEVDGKQRSVHISRDRSGEIADPVVKTLRINRSIMVSTFIKER